MGEKGRDRPQGLMVCEEKEKEKASDKGEREGGNRSSGAVPDHRIRALEPCLQAFGDTLDQGKVRAPFQDALLKTGLSAEVVGPFLNVGVAVKGIAATNQHEVKRDPRNVGERVLLPHDPGAAFERGFELVETVLEDGLGAGDVLVGDLGGAGEGQHRQGQHDQEDAGGGAHGAASRTTAFHRSSVSLKSTRPSSTSFRTWAATECAANGCSSTS